MISLSFFKQGRSRSLLPLLLIAVALGAAYWNSFSVPFVLDDLFSIQANPNYQPPTSFHKAIAYRPLEDGGETPVGRPVEKLSIVLNVLCGGLKVWGFHAVNLAIHILAAWALYGVVRRTLRLPGLADRFGGDADMLALAIALLWGLHPLDTEAVTYIVQRTEALMGLFYLLTLYCFIRAMERPSAKAGKKADLSRRSLGEGGWMVCSIAACALGMGSKEVMVSAPVIVLFYDRIFVAGSFREAWRRRSRFYLALAATWLLLAYLVATTGYRGGTAGFFATIQWYHYVADQSAGVTRYLRLAFWPDELILDYGFGWLPLSKTLAPLLFLAALFAGTLVALRRWPGIGFLGIFFFAILAPTALVPILTQTVAEHRAYLALTAVVALVVLALYRVGGRRIWPFLAAVALFFGFLTAQRNHTYQNRIELWAETADRYVFNWRSHFNLAGNLESVDRMPEAIEHLREASSIFSGNALVPYQLGIALLRVHKDAEALVVLRQTAALPPPHDVTRNAFGPSLAGLIDAVEHPHKPGSAEIREYSVGLSAPLRFQPDPNDLPDKIIAGAKTILAFQPDCFDAHYNIGLQLLSTGRAAEALKPLREALRSTPYNPIAHRSLGLALINSGDIVGGMAELHESLRLDPNSGARDDIRELESRHIFPPIPP